MTVGPSRSVRSSSTKAEAHRAIEAIWRIESARLIAGLARVVGDIGTAEELAQDALVAALEQWPAEGVPQRPGAWLMGTAKHRAIDLIRRRRTLERKHEELGRDAERAQEGRDLEAAMDETDEEVGDDLLGLIFMACHPVLSKDARVALTLRVLCGLTTEEIARAFLVPGSTIAQRIVRAKREEALRLGRILAELAPTEPEVHGLVALMEIQASRLGARVGPSGEPILLLNQDRARWDRLLIRRGLAALERAERLGGALGPYALQAAIAACHARATTATETDWPRIVALYDAVAQLAPSPVVELNRAVAVGMAFGPAAALDLVDALAAEPSLKSYHLLPAVRGDLLRKLGRFEEARAEFERAASLTENMRERELLQRRAAECAAERMAG